VIAAHIRQLKRIERWMQSERPTLHVPVDSPAANFPICKISRRQGLRICHLAAPQLWAWAPWRIRKLRRLTDRVLCLLPFEEQWFESRGVPATFIGHPIFDAPFDAEAVRARAGALPDAARRVALMPGSRPKEHERNFPVMLGAFRELRRRHPELAGVVAAVSPEAERRLRGLADRHGGWPEGLELLTGDVEAVIAWADLCLAVSGTVTLHIVRQVTPMIVMFKASPAMYHLFARWLIYADFLAMPNLLAGRQVVPELMPYFGGPERLVGEAETLLTDDRTVAAQRDALAEVRAPFDRADAASRAADALLALLPGCTASEPAASAAG
jgi:lipid-A-disaccharide synthase